MDYLWALAEAVERDPHLRGELDYRPNSSLYQVGDRLLFAEASQGRSGRSYQLVAVGATPYLMQTLARARVARGSAPWPPRWSTTTSPAQTPMSTSPNSPTARSS